MKAERRLLALQLELEVAGDVVLVVDPDLKESSDPEQRDEQKQSEQHQKADSQARGQ